MFFIVISVVLRIVPESSPVFWYRLIMTKFYDLFYRGSIEICPVGQISFKLISVQYVRLEPYSLHITVVGKIQYDGSNIL
jgi:hypothetical protein